MSDRETLARRLTDVGLIEDRLIPVADGSKASEVRHNDASTRESSFASLSGNYGVYAGANPASDRWLIDVDIDDYADDADSDALEAVTSLPETFTVASPHTDGDTGGHRYYYIDGKDVHKSIETVAGAKNPGPSWGEIRVHNQYVVGPGSQLDECDKEWCDECKKPNGGHYEIANDAPIAELTLPELFKVIRADESDENTPQNADPVDTDRDTPTTDGDDSQARAVAEHYQNIKDYLLYGSDDRSEMDFHVCCRMIEHGVGESEAYRLLANNPRTKVDSTDASSDYWQRTWDKAKRKVGNDADSESLPTTDGGTVADTQATDAPQTDTDSLSWDAVYRNYAGASEADERKPARFKATELLSESHHWANLEENDVLYAYDSDRGIYNPTGEKKVRQLLVEHLQEQYAKNEKNEILDQLRGRHTVSQEDMGGPSNHVPVRNGVLEVQTKGIELKDHAPEYRFLGSVATAYDPDAECPQSREFLNDVVQAEAQRKKLQEYAGYTLMHWSLPYHKALFLVGPTASGKSTFLDTIRAVLGSDTVVSLTPQELTGERFAGAELFQSWANFRNDIPSSLIEDTGAFKEITAGDSIKAEQKFKDPFRFEPNAKHLFSANQLPDAETEDEAFYRRVLLVPFPSTVPKDDRDPHLDEKLQSELSGVLNWMLEGLQRLMQQGQFTADRTPGETQRTWEKWGNTVDRFRETCLTKDESEDLPKQTAYQAYHAYCESENLPAETQHKMTRRLKSEGIADGRTYIDGERQRVFVGVTLTDRGESYLTDDSDESRDTGLGNYGE
ncbi:phage/plasmid primase, P4 family [Halorhabdus sp. CUG00001]|uniref:phage/plasmid primase, P4 family n=1 Tax=Halorhabdus sp. CUG00001 TaxID=2600297 RepID=UPI00131E5514|nr:phage/plasmid primase, P4 family [Halorhabdus sp. CUG00001]